MQEELGSCGGWVCVCADMMVLAARHSRSLGVSRELNLELRRVVPKFRSLRYLQIPGLFESKKLEIQEPWIGLGEVPHFEQGGGFAKRRVFC